ncbi:D-tyrosyl-tRNA(Tyr) deacylase [bacterium]|nr:MAG: D-tyrosyl-tRNA(Tyr) deacylase [bacterium]
MRIVVQRVSRASVTVERKIISRIGKGLVLLIGFKEGDTNDDLSFWAEKCVNLRIFEDNGGKMNVSLLESGGEILAVSQFTLYGDVRKGRRPSFIEAARPEAAEPLYNAFVELLRAKGVKVSTGIFGAMMDVELINAGPVTILLDNAP